MYRAQHEECGGCGGEGGRGGVIVQITFRYRTMTIHIFTDIYRVQKLLNIFADSGQNVE